MKTRLNYREAKSMRKTKKAEKAYRMLRVATRRGKNYFNVEKDMESLAA